MSWRQIAYNPAVYLVKVPFTNLITTATNCYVVVDGNDALVIDTGAPTSEGKRVLQEALADIGAYRRNLSFFITHFHLDHIGLVDKVAPEKAHLYANRLERDDFYALEDDASRIAFAAQLEARGVPASESASIADMQRQVSGLSLFDETRVSLRFVDEGDELAVGRYRLRVMNTAGHTPGHLSLHMPARNLLFTGDHVLFTISPSIALFPNEQDGLARYLDELRRIDALGCERMLVSHGDERPDFRERIAWLIDHHEKRIERTRELAAEDPDASDFELVKRMNWNVPFSRWDDIPVIQRFTILSTGFSTLDHVRLTG